jgi:hypothetical protein
MLEGGEGRGWTMEQMANMQWHFAGAAAAGAPTPGAGGPPPPPPSPPRDPEKGAAIAEMRVPVIAAKQGSGSNSACRIRQLFPVGFRYGLASERVRASTFSSPTGKIPTGSNLYGMRLVAFRGMQ